MRVELEELPAAALHPEDAEVARLFVAWLNPRDQAVNAHALAAFLKEHAIPADLQAYYAPSADCAGAA